MKYAEVAVNAPGGYRHAFTYSLPENLEVRVGYGVLVPFGPRTLQGIVVNLTDYTSFPETKEIIGLIDPLISISPMKVELAQWITDYYLAPLFTAVALMLPPAFESGKEIKPRYVKYIELNPDADPVGDAVARLRQKRAVKQAEVLELIAQRGTLTVKQIEKQTGCGSSVINSLLAAGLIKQNVVQQSRDPLSRIDLPLELPLTFTNSQLSAWSRLQAAVARKNGGEKSSVFLLHGVTGSGKTEIYLRALQETVHMGKKGICLVPEIALTAQTIDRFFARFPGRVAVLHSKLSIGEQYDEWQRIYRGHFDVVIGPRSAIFAPQPDIGLIIVDEEHEWAYKQTDKMPRYHARDVALKLAELTGAILILGSATPDVCSYYKSRNNEYELIELKERATVQGGLALPEVSIVNMRDELKAGNRGIFSRLLKDRIGVALQRDEQVVLFINRRGSANFVQCWDCGFVLSCKRCAVVLTYHAAGDKLLCHHCRRVYPMIKKCPACSSSRIRYSGIGTETVEAECRKLFPSARVIRFDSDTMARTKEYERTVRSFKRHEADILVGTQILAKGLDFPEVTLVGIVNADTGLNFPDFRASERTFQLLCQVEGRAGRGLVAGRAVIQTYSPENYAIKFAARHDYSGFYESEIKYRRSFGYPPFSRMVRMVYSNSKQEKCRRETERVAKLIRTTIAEVGLTGFKVVGPAPAFIARLRGRFQMQVIIIGQDIQGIIKDIDLPSGWILDVDPVGMV